MRKLCGDPPAPDMVMKAALDINLIDPIDMVISHSEYDLDIASLIRDTLNIPGAKIEDNELYRNKVAMKQALRNSSVLTPPFKKIHSMEDILQFINQVGFPCILKPEEGAASENVTKISCLEEIKHMDCYEGYQIEKYISGDIYHVDAIISGEAMPYFKVSKYINTCLDFRNRTPLGSYTITNKEINTTLVSFTQEVVALLNIQNQAIHLEVIEHDGKFYFLEIGGRVGGGEIPFVALKSEGIDLFDLWTKASLYEEIKPVDNKITGFLMYPNPFDSGYELPDDFSVDSELVSFQKINVDGEYSGFSYENIPARVHFEGNSSEEVALAIKSSMDQISSEIKPLLPHEVT